MDLVKLYAINTNYIENLRDLLATRLVDVNYIGINCGGNCAGNFLSNAVNSTGSDKLLISQMSRFPDTLIRYAVEFMYRLHSKQRENLLQCMQALAEFGCDFSDIKFSANCKKEQLKHDKKQNGSFWDDNEAVNVHHDVLYIACFMLDHECVATIIQCCRKYYNRTTIESIANNFNTSKSNDSEIKQNDETANIDTISGINNSLVVKSGKEMLETMLNRYDEQGWDRLCLHNAFQIMQLLLECPELKITKYIGSCIIRAGSQLREITRGRKGKKKRERQNTKNQILGNEISVATMFYQILSKPESNLLQRLSTVENLIQIFVDYFTKQYDKAYYFEQENPILFNENQKHNMEYLTNVDKIINRLCEFMSTKPTHIRQKLEDAEASFAANINVTMESVKHQFMQYVLIDRQENHFSKVYDIDFNTNGDDNYFISVGSDGTLHIYKYEIIDKNSNSNSNSNSNGDNRGILSRLGFKNNININGDNNGNYTRVKMFQWSMIINNRDMLFTGRFSDESRNYNNTLVCCG